MGRRKEMARQTTVWFTEDDWALIEFVKEQSGARTRADALRMAIRAFARQFDPGVVHRVARKRRAAPADQRQEES
jgi:sulfur relay (sulfurtransferase) DsrC/TusE family protein